MASLGAAQPASSTSPPHVPHSAPPVEERRRRGERRTDPHCLCPLVHAHMLVHTGCAHRQVAILLQFPGRGRRTSCTGISSGRTTDTAHWRASQKRYQPADTPRRARTAQLCSPFCASDSALLAWNGIAACRNDCGASPRATSLRLPSAGHSVPRLLARYTGTALAPASCTAMPAAPRLPPPADAPLPGGPFSGPVAFTGWCHTQRTRSADSFLHPVDVTALRARAIPHAACTSWREENLPHKTLTFTFSLHLPYLLVYTTWKEEGIGGRRKRGGRAMGIWTIFST